MYPNKYTTYSTKFKTIFFGHRYAQNIMINAENQSFEFKYKNI